MDQTKGILDDSNQKLNETNWYLRNLCIKKGVLLKNEHYQDHINTSLIADDLPAYEVNIFKTRSSLVKKFSYLLEKNKSVFEDEKDNLDSLRSILNNYKNDNDVFKLFDEFLQLQTKLKKDYKLVIEKLKLDSFLSPFGHSTILTRHHDAKSLLDLCDFKVLKCWKNIYRATRDGFDVQDFHSKCDNIKSVLIIVKTKNDYIFGGYTNCILNIREIYEKDPNSFIFSFKNHLDKPVRINPIGDRFSIGTSPSCLFAFGAGPDLCIENSSKGFSCLGVSFNHDILENTDADCFLAGSEVFDVKEIEVYRGFEDGTSQKKV